MPGGNNIANPGPGSASVVYPNNIKLSWPYPIMHARAWCLIAGKPLCSKSRCSPTIAGIPASTAAAGSQERPERLVTIQYIAGAGGYHANLPPLNWFPLQQQLLYRMLAKQWERTICYGAGAGQHLLRFLKIIKRCCS